MMRRFTAGSLRVTLLAAVVVLLVVAVSGTLAQAPADAAAVTAPPKGKGVFALIVEHMDWVFATIGILSVVGLTLIIQGFIKTRRAVYMPDESVATMRQLIEQKQFRELLEFTEADPSFVAKALNPALKRAPSFNSMKEAMETAVAEQTAEKFRNIEYLNIIGNLGPLLGLLGTVLGMIYAFSDMQAAQGKTDPSVLAGGIGTALTHTFLGLMLAVPCLAAFGVLRTMVDRLTVQSALVAEELLLMIKPQEARQPAAIVGTPRPAGAPAAPAPRKVAPPPAPPVEA
jgi:biopolymer transport protein ExbB